MAKDDSIWTFAKLTGPDNYKQWARQMQFALMVAGRWPVVAGKRIRPAVDGKLTGEEKKEAIKKQEE